QHRRQRGGSARGDDACRDLCRRSRRQSRDQDRQADLCRHDAQTRETEEAEMTELGEFLRRDRSWHPATDTPAYRSTTFRAPRRALLSLPQSIGELSGPVFGHGAMDPLDNDLIRNYATTGDAIGERILVHGTVMDENGRPVPGALIEIWQANAGGKYRHVNDKYMAALDPNFGGCGD